MTQPDTSMSTRKYTYDEECEDLARHFLATDAKGPVQELAQHIQDAIEDWIFKRNI